MPSASPPSSGQHQIQVVTFPCSYCTTAADDQYCRPRVADNLEGFAKKAYDFYEKELRPLGYKLHAEIISFPAAYPARSALFLKW